MFQNVLIVCIGNICRSPMAEIVLRARLQAKGRDVSVASAGLGAMVAHAIDATAQEVLVEHGLDGRAHVARQLDEAMLRRADLILAMETAHVHSITRRAPQVRGRTFLLGKWCNDLPVPDPWRQSREVFERTYKLIDITIDSWLGHF